MPTDLHAWLRGRRSVRHFTGEPISQAVITRLLETAECAPSAHDLRPWRFVLVAGTRSREHLGAALTKKMSADMASARAPAVEIEARVERSLRRLANAPAVIVLCRDTTAVRDASEQERHMAIQSVALAGMQLLLAAHAEGLGAVWICWPLFAHAETAQALSLPSSWEPQAMFFLGKPQPPAPAPRTKRRASFIVR